MDLPPEYVLHLLPLMAICGLPPSQPHVSSPTQKRAGTSPLIDKPASPRPPPSLASIPYIDADLGRAILGAIDQWRALALWEPFASRDRQIPGASLEGIFRVVPVDRSFRLPVQKLRSSADLGLENEKALHSPLSPLTPESPLYPDGIMTTMWIRKHRDIIPAVFVSFYELYSEEKLHNLSDEDLARHLFELKKSYADRGVKLCAVLTGPWEADQISTRLEYLRRNSSLDSKTGLFYLPPPSNENSLLEFFKMLRQSQYPFAIEHYRLRFNKTKRRRPRIPPAIPNAPLPLDAKGWSVRINFKLGAYSEYKQELDVAVKFYELAYNELTDLFSSTAALPPRSKRWAEARVLADSISYKLWKLFLYLGDHAKVIWTFNTHIRRMSTLCNGWGLGVETADYWHWLARNYRIFADLVQISETIIVGENEIEEGIKLITGDSILNTDMILQHPGYYYLLAADCIRRKQAKTVELESLSADAPNESGSKKVDLNAAMLENLSLSMEQFGKRKSHRIGAYIELSKCKSHHYAKKFDVALDLLQPVLKIYRMEGWYELLGEALLLSLDCATQIHHAGSVLQYSLELISDEFSLTDNSVFKFPSFVSVSNHSEEEISESKAKAKIVLMANEFVSFIKPSFTFQSKSAFAGSNISFQLSLQSRSRKSLPAIVFSSAQIIFNEQIPDIVVRHVDTPSSGFQKLGSNITTGVANLSLEPGQTKVLEFSYTPIAQAQLEARSLSLKLETEDLSVTLQFPFEDLADGTPADALWVTEDSKAPRLLRHGNSRHVHPKPPKVTLSTTLHGPAYTGEKLPILITLENGEEETVTLGIQFDSPEIEGEGAQSIFSWQDSAEKPSESNLLAVGNILAAERRECILLFNAPSAPTECTLSIVIKYTLESDRLTEIRKPLLFDIPVIQPFHTAFDILPALVEDEGMPDPFGDEEYPLQILQKWILMSSITRLGSDNIEVQRIAVARRQDRDELSLDISETEVISSSSNEVLVLDTRPNDAKTNLALTRPENTEITLLHLDLSITWRRQSSSRKKDWNTIIIAVPELTFFPFAPRILADVTPHNLYSEYPQYLLTYTFENPTSTLLRLELHMESSEACGFAGARQIRTGLLPYTTYVLKVIVLPLEEGWIRLPRLTAVDDERKKVLEILKLTDELKVEGADLLLRVPASN